MRAGGSFTVDFVLHPRVGIFYQGSYIIIRESDVCSSRFRRIVVLHRIICRGYFRARNTVPIEEKIQFVIDVVNTHIFTIYVTQSHCVLGFIPHIVYVITPVRDILHGHPLIYIEDDITIFAVCGAFDNGSTCRADDRELCIFRILANRIHSNRVSGSECASRL